MPVPRSGAGTAVEAIVQWPGTPRKTASPTHGRLVKGHLEDQQEVNMQAGETPRLPFASIGEGTPVRTARKERMPDPAERRAAERFPVNADASCPFLSPVVED